MTLVPTDIRDIIFKTFRGDMTTDEFENWLYQTKELEKIIPPDSYFELISYNFKQPNPLYGLSKILETLVELGEYETWKLQLLLTQVVDKIDNYPKAITKFYDLYCKGYYFLDNLAFGYGLPLDCPWSEYGVHSFDQLTPQQQLTLADKFYPDIIREIKKVENWLDTKKIILTGMHDSDLGRLQFIDTRTDDEKQATTYKVDKR